MKAPTQEETICLPHDKLTIYSYRFTVTKNRDVGSKNRKQ